MRHNIWISVSLVGLIGLCGAMIPWKDLTRPSKSAVKDALRARFEQYKALRLQNDWDTLYDLTAPAHRERVDKRKFLQFYGHGMLATRSLELTDLAFDERLNVGATKFHVVTELVRQNLPPQARSVQVNSPDDLRREGQLELEWQRVGGQWYYLMDDEVVSGKAGDQPITPGATTPAPTTPDQQPR